MENANDCLIIIQRQLCSTKNFLLTLSALVCNNTELLNWFKELCKGLTKMIVLLTNYHKKVNNDMDYKQTLLFYLQQLLTSLSLLINIFEKESEAREMLTEIRIFCKKQLISSLDGIEKLLSNPFTSESHNGNFIKWMDSALDKLNEIECLHELQESKLIFMKTKLNIEEVLSHAMSIAQVTLLDDYMKIRGSSQSVLEALGSLETEIQKSTPNSAMLNLFIDACTNKLCALERKVNTAVLKLSLKVFSEYTVPLEAIHNFCFNELNGEKQEDLDNLIVEFDLHVDRILQIGLFAVSCSTSSNDCVKIKSCLASLEALEAELVPSFTSALKNLSPKKMLLSLILKNYWINQAKTLQKWICKIIDPFAFCEVIYEENKILVDEISENMKNKSLLDNNAFKKLMQQTKVLEDFIKVVLEEEQEHNIVEIKRAYNDFKCVFHEVKSAFDILSDDKNGHLRILKRCKILLSTIKSLWNCFLNENNENESISSGEQSFVEKSTVEQASKPVCGNAFLDHIITKGKEILKDRSVLRLQNVTTAQGNETYRKTPILEPHTSNLKLAHLRSKLFITSSYKNKTSELQMTDILNELNNLTNVSLA